MEHTNFNDQSCSITQAWWVKAPKGHDRSIKDHMLVHELDEKMQSAYKRGHSTETALPGLKNDIVMTIDGRKAMILVLVDLSAAFNTIDHVW